MGGMAIIIDNRCSSGLNADKYEIRASPDNAESCTTTGVVRKVIKMARLAQLAIEEQPAPVFGNGEYVANDLIDWTREMDPEVVEAIYARKQVGIERYGQTLQTNDGRNTLADLVQKLLDAMIYAHKGVMESETKTSAWYIYSDARYNLNRVLAMIARYS